MNTCTFDDIYMKIHVSSMLAIGINKHTQQTNKQYVCTYYWYFKYMYMYMYMYKYIYMLEVFHVYMYVHCNSWNHVKSISINNQQPTACDNTTVLIYIYKRNVLEQRAHVLAHGELLVTLDKHNQHLTLDKHNQHLKHNQHSYISVHLPFQEILVIVLLACLWQSSTPGTHRVFLIVFMNKVLVLIWLSYHIRE